MKTSESLKNIAPALAKVIGEVKDAYKEKEGYGYSYAPLDQVLKIVRPILAKNELSVIQSETYEDDKVIVETMLLHSSGEYIVTTVSAPFERLKGMNAYQIAGSAITYLRRYGLSASLGIAADEDNDAAGEVEEAQTITDMQVLELEKLIAQAQVDKEKFMEYFQITKLEDMPRDLYPKAVAVLNKKLEQGAA